MGFINWLKQKILGFKVITKEQYNEIVKMLILKKDEMFSAADENGDGTIQLNEILKGIKKIVKAAKEKVANKTEEVK